MTRLDATFVALIGLQALHSIEEYLGRLYEVFPPARIVSGLIFGDPRRGFIVFNVALVLFGVWCFLWPIRRRWASAAGFVWFWVVVEIGNGVIHSAWSLIQGGYTPGVATAPMLLVLALLLAHQIRAVNPPLSPAPRHHRGVGP